jgi:hypothetical protein
MDHPCVPWLELKALNGLKRIDDALNIFTVLISHKDLNTEIGISALLNVLQSYDANALPTIRNGFFLLQSKFPNNKELIALTLEKLLENTLKNDCIEFALEISKTESIRALIQDSDHISSESNSADRTSGNSESQFIFGLFWNWYAFEFPSPASIPIPIPAHPFHIG